ncbi:MAG: endonuclease NucS [Thermoprotei archaeon]
MEVLRNASLDEYAEFIRKGVMNKQLLVIIGKCSVDYTGRGGSRLTEGERLVIIKQDGALLVHRPTGYKPVNWQPSTSIIEVKNTGDSLVITAIRDKPREIVNIRFTNIDLVVRTKLVDTGEFVMYLDELEVRDILFEHPELIEEGLRFTEKEKSIGSGSADLFGYDKNGRPVIVEIKRVTAGREAVHQLYTYVKTYEEITGIKPRGILVAPSLASSAIEALNKLRLEWKEIDLKKLWKLKREKSFEQESILKYLRDKQ